MDNLAPHCIVKIDSANFDSWEGKNLISAEVNLTTDKSGEGVVELYDPDFKIIDGIFSNGIKSALATFYFGWEMNLGNPLFSGSLARTEWNDNITTLRFHDHSLKMKQEKKTRYFKKQSDYKILKKLAEDSGLKFVVESRFTESQPFDSLIQTGKTDWEFAKKIAAQSGLNLYVKGDTLFAVEAGTTKLNKPISALNLNSDFRLLRNFGLTYKLPKNPKTRPNKIEVRGRGKGGKLLKGETISDEGGRTDLILSDLPQQTISIAERKAKGKLGKQREYAFEHHLSTLPTFRTIIQLRNTVTFAGMGKFYSGDYIVTEIKYSFKAGSLACELSVGADKKGSK